MSDLGTSSVWCATLQPIFNVWEIRQCPSVWVRFSLLSIGLFQLLWKKFPIKSCKQTNFWITLVDRFIVTKNELEVQKSTPTFRSRCRHDAWVLNRRHLPLWWNLQLPRYREQTESLHGRVNIMNLMTDCLSLSSLERCYLILKTLRGKQTSRIFSGLVHCSRNCMAKSNRIWRFNRRNYYISLKDWRSTVRVFFGLNWDEDFG